MMSHQELLDCVATDACEAIHAMQAIVQAAEAKAPASLKARALVHVAHSWAQWSKPLADLLDSIAHAASFKISDADFTSFVGTAVGRIPNMFKQLKPDLLAQSFESIMGAAILAGAQGSIARKARVFHAREDYLSAVELKPVAVAVKKLSKKTHLGSLLKSADWERVPLAVRERAFFSAQVENVRLLSSMQEQLKTLLDGSRNLAGVITDRTKFVKDMSAMAIDLGLMPKNPALRGTIQDITSQPRLELIADMQVDSAYGFADYKAGQDQDALDAYPAQELIRVEDRTEPRPWLEIWDAAGGTLFDGRMIAMKTDAIWEKISRFSTPWPPFDFNSGMGLQDVDALEAQELGLMQPGQQVTPSDSGFNDRLQASLGGANHELKSELKAFFGNQVDFSGDTVTFQEAA